MTKSAANCGFGQISWKNPERKTSLFGQSKLLLTNTQALKLPKAFVTVLKILSKSVLMTLGLTAAAAVTDAAIHKNIVQCARHSDLDLRNTTLIISNE